VLYVVCLGRAGFSCVLCLRRELVVCLHIHFADVVT